MEDRWSLSSSLFLNSYVICVWICLDSRVSTFSLQHFAVKKPLPSKNRGQFCFEVFSKCLCDEALMPSQLTLRLVVYVCRLLCAS